ncbi:MAG TPA: hypothetical protein VEU72_01450 [Nitrosopumilaceae archaeon]|nr:hypothetical protein [Nitrosopumilaceae archaeon]
MKTLHLSIIIFSLALVPILSNAAFGSEPCPTGGYIHYGPSRQSIPCYLVSSPSNPTLEEQFGHMTQTKLIHDNAILILNQTTKKLAYQSGEDIIVIPELINIGNKKVEIAYCEPLFVLEIKNQTGDVVWPQSTGVVCVPEFHGNITLEPGEQFGTQPWGPNIFPQLSIPGNYTLTSVALFSFNTNAESWVSIESLWSKPIQITILPEKYVQNETVSCYGYGCGQNSSALKQALLAKQLGLTGPPRGSLSPHDNENNSWLTVVEIGSIAGGVAVGISVYVIRIRK